MVHDDGSVLIMFKGRGHNGNTYSHMSLGVAKALPFSARTKCSTTISLFSAWKNKAKQKIPSYGKMLRDTTSSSKTRWPGSPGEKGGGVLAHSKDGVKWTIDKDPKAYSRTLEWSDGKTEMQGQLERPFILFEHKRPAYLFFATMDGPGGFNNATRSWNMVIPFKP